MIYWILFLSFLRSNCSIIYHHRLFVSENLLKRSTEVRMVKKPTKLRRVLRMFIKKRVAKSQQFTFPFHHCLAFCFAGCFLSRDYNKCFFYFLFFDCKSVPNHLLASEILGGTNQYDGFERAIIICAQ